MSARGRADPRRDQYGPPLKRRPRRWLVYWLVQLGMLAVIAAGLMWLGLAMAGAHDPYTNWRVPENPAVSCCHGEDCRPTRAYMGEDGRWRAWDGLGWVIVPPGTVLPTDLAGDGRNHLCIRAGRVLCFSPTMPKG